MPIGHCAEMEWNGMSPLGTFWEAWFGSELGGFAAFCENHHNLVLQ